MKTKRLKRWLVGLAFCVCAGVTMGSRPNVILIMTDDQGYGDVSAHGNPVLKTPALDKLHAQSVRFTDFHVAPKCTPTRGQLMTGIDAMRNGATRVCQGRSMVRRELKMMPQYFAEAGYATGMFGKWHLGDSYPHPPRFRGFQEVLSFRAWGITSLADYWGNDYFDPVLEHNGVDKPYKGYCTDIFFNAAMDWMAGCRKQGKPFFMYLPTNTPHVPEQVDKKYSAPYGGKHNGEAIPGSFYGMIANIDENIGKLEAFLEKRGLRNNTILIFLSDNGTQNTRAMNLFNAGMRAKKGSVVDGGHRVPLFVRWVDGKLQHGTDVSELATVQDLLPTLMDLCGLEGDRSAFNGTSLAGLLKGTQEKLQARMIVNQIGFSCTEWDQAVVMNGKWRLLKGKRGPELHNTANDLHQDRNVAGQHPEIAKAMADHYDAWYAESKPLFDKPRWITVGSAAANPLMLYAQDWVGGYCDNRGGLMQATATGYWNVIVDRDGIYKLELRRWPVEANMPLALGTGPDGKKGARPIAAANVQIGGANYTLGCSPRDTHATFTIRLKAGKATLATHLLDIRGNTLCSAMYVKVTRLSDATGTMLTPPSAAAAAPVELAPNDILVADFEGETYGDWRATGTAFGKGPTGTKDRVVGHHGNRLVDTFLVNESDGPTGVLTSPLFSVERKYINLLIGGGGIPGQTCVNLMLDGKTVHSAVGSAAKDSQKRKIMHWVSWDVSGLAGRNVQLQVVDRSSGGWGHIMVDHVFLSDRPAEEREKGR